jgi:hypothetical protein
MGTKKMRYRIDEKHIKENYLYVEINDDVVFEIKQQEDGYIVNLFSLKNEDEPLASTWVDKNSLNAHALLKT